MSWWRATIRGGDSRSWLSRPRSRPGKSTSYARRCPAHGMRPPPDEAHLAVVERPVRFGMRLLCRRIGLLADNIGDVVEAEEAEIKRPPISARSTAGSRLRWSGLIVTFS